MAINDKTIPIQLILDKRSLNKTQAVTELNKTIPILFTGILALEGQTPACKKCTKHQIEK